MKHIHLYKQSLQSALECGESDLWKKSHHANIDCAKAIEKEIAASFDGMHLDKDAASRVIDRFGWNRVNWVLQTTVQLKDYDGRFRPVHRAWAKEVFTDYIRDETRQYAVESHPAVLDGFIAQTRRAWAALNLHDHTHCEPDSSAQNYDGKVLVLDPMALKDQYKTPRDQLFLCSGGFGARAGAMGRKVFGQFLSDGELASFERSDFLGVLRDEHLPDWAREKLEQSQSNTPSPEMNLGDRG